MTKLIYKAFIFSDQPPLTLCLSLTSRFNRKHVKVWKQDSTKMHISSNQSKPLWRTLIFQTKCRPLFLLWKNYFYQKRRLQCTLLFSCCFFTWFLICLLSSCICTQLMTLASKLLRKAQTLPCCFLSLLSFLSACDTSHGSPMSCGKFFLNY